MRQVRPWQGPMPARVTRLDFINGAVTGPDTVQDIFSCQILAAAEDCVPIVHPDNLLLCISYFHGEIFGNGQADRTGLVGFASGVTFTTGNQPTSHRRGSGRRPAVLLWEAGEIRREA